MASIADSEQWPRVMDAVAMNAPDAPFAVQTLLKQLDLIWLFADQHVLPQIDEAAAYWEPSPNCVSVRRLAGKLVADWPDETAEILPETTVAWLLWHIEWWWSNTLTVCRGGRPLAPDEYEWSGAVTRIRTLRDEWVELLETTDPDTVITGLMPDPSPLWEIAGWVNFELTKNISEIGQMLTRRANTPT